MQCHLLTLVVFAFHLMDNISLLLDSLYFVPAKKIHQDSARNRR